MTPTSAVPHWVSHPHQDSLIDSHCAICCHARHEQRFRETPYSVVECSDCGLVYVTPQRKAENLLAELYEDRLWSSPAPRYFGYGAYREEAQNYLRTFERRVRAISRFLPSSGTVLDVGCAAGYFLAVMREKGWTVTGVEPSETIASFGMRKFDIPILVGRVEQMSLKAASFDLITLWDVIEHVPNPREFLLHLRKLLKPGGKILLETQDVQSPVARLLGKRWHHYKHAEHLWHFSPATIRQLLSGTGLAVERITHRGAGKYIPLSFVAERASRLPRFMAAIIQTLLLPLKRRVLYVNLYDEMVVIASAETTY